MHKYTGKHLNHSIQTLNFYEVHRSSSLNHKVQDAQLKEAQGNIRGKNATKASFVKICISG